MLYFRNMLEITQLDIAKDLVEFSTALISLWLAGRSLAAQAKKKTPQELLCIGQLV
jgi:hypothetical protein